MPRLRKVKRIVDAMVTQKRVIIHLDCGHNMSITEAQMDKSPFLFSRAEQLREFMCTICPDPPSEGEGAEPANAFHKLFKE